MGDVRCEECRGSGIVVEMMMSEFPVPIMCVRCSSTGCPRRGGVMDHEGARWQREAMLSDESAERVADVLVALDGDDYLIVARAALSAALGMEET